MGDERRSGIGSKHIEFVYIVVVKILRDHGRIFHLVVLSEEKSRAGNLVVRVDEIRSLNEPGEYPFRYSLRRKRRVFVVEDNSTVISTAAKPNQHTVVIVACRS